MMVAYIFNGDIIGVRRTSWRQHLRAATVEYAFRYPCVPTLLIPTLFRLLTYHPSAE